MEERKVSVLVMEFQSRSSSKWNKRLIRENRPESQWKQTPFHVIAAKYGKRSCLAHQCNFMRVR